MRIRNAHFLTKDMADLLELRPRDGVTLSSRAEYIQMASQPGKQHPHGFAEDRLGKREIFVPWQTARAEDAWRVAQRSRGVVWHDDLYE